MNITIVISTGWGIRVFLQTPVLAELQKIGKVYLLVSNALLEGLEKEGIICAGSAALLPFDIQSGEYEKTYRKRGLLFNRFSRTATRRYNENQYMNVIPLKKRIKVTAKKLWNILTTSKAKYPAFFLEESLLFSREYPQLEEYYRSLFEQWDTDLVLVTTPHINEEIPPVLTANKMGIKTGAWINSWDNLTSKAAYRAPFDVYFLWSEHLAGQLRQYYPEAKGKPIFATGAPHFDWYFSSAYYLTREEFCTMHNFDPEARILLYATCTPHLYPDEHLLVERLIQEGNQVFPTASIQWIIRLHRGDPGQRFKHLFGLPDIWFQIPNPTGGLESFFPSFEANRAFVNTFRYADIVINTASTITIDAAIVDVPVINIAFDIAGNKRMDQIIREYYKYDHFKTIVELKASKIAYNYDMLLEALQLYLSNRNLDQEGRAAIVELWCGKVDGRSAERLASKVNSFIKE
jgi:hypothetical protein